MKNANWDGSQGIGQKGVVANGFSGIVGVEKRSHRNAGRSGFKGMMGCGTKIAG